MAAESLGRSLVCPEELLTLYVGFLSRTTELLSCATLHTPRRVSTELDIVYRHNDQEPCCSFSGGWLKQREISVVTMIRAEVEREKLKLGREM